MEPGKRPLVLTAYCIFVVAVNIAQLTLALLSVDTLGLPRLIYSLAWKAIILVAIVGLWRMQRWGFYVLANVILISTVAYFIWPPDPPIPALLVILSVMIGFGILCAVTLPFWKRFVGEDIFDL